MSTVELQIVERARKFKGEALKSLYPFIDAQLLQESYEKLNRRSAAGIDGKTWEEYGKDFPQRRDKLLEEFKSGRYKAPAVRRGKYSKVKTVVAQSVSRLFQFTRYVDVWYLLLKSSIRHTCYH